MANWPYNTAAWQRLRKAKLSRDPLCEDCQAMGRITPANHVDHCHAISDGGDAFPPLDELSSKCAPCHSAKTARGAEAGAVRSSKPRRGCSTDGTPLDSKHPWTIIGTQGEQTYEGNAHNARVCHPIDRLQLEATTGGTTHCAGQSDRSFDEESDPVGGSRSPAHRGERKRYGEVEGAQSAQGKSLRADAEGPPRNYNFELVSGGPTDGC